MSVISLDAQQLNILNQEIMTLDNSLLHNYLPELESQLNLINYNVKGDEINSIINSILSQFQGVKSSLSTDLPKLEQFLEQQLKSYTQSEEVLEQAVLNIIYKMDHLYENLMGNPIGQGNFPSPNDSNYWDILSERANLENS